MEFQEDNNFSGTKIPFEKIYTDVENKGYERLLSYIEKRINDIQEYLNMADRNSEAAVEINEFLEILILCHSLMPNIVKETSYRYITHRATSEEIELLANQ